MSEKNSKILRWRLELENYDYDVIYKEGRANAVADSLSRIPLKEEILDINLNDASSDCATIHSANTPDDYYIHFSERPINYYRNQIIFRLNSNLDTVITEEVFPKFMRIILMKPSFEREEISHYLKTYHNGKQSAILAPEALYQKLQESFRENFSENGHFVFVTKLVQDVTNEVHQDSIITKEHDRAHRGINEVENQIKQSYYFPNMLKKIKNYTNSCSICNIHKYERKPYNIKISPRPITHKPLERIHIDIFIINKTQFLSIIDSFTKHLQMIQIESKNLLDVRNAMAKYFSTIGLPNTIISDHETTFQSI